MNKTYQDEQNEVLEYLLNNIYTLFHKPFSDVRQQDSNEDILMNLKHHNILELYITASCNQACTYCYLVKNGDKLYPQDIRSPQTILNNLDILLNYYLELGLEFHRIDIFSGEIWGSPLGNQVLEIIKKYLKKGLYIKDIVIPSNFSFCQDLKTMKIIDAYIGEFALLGCHIGFSCSMDGPYLDKINRPFINGKEKTEEYYTNIFEFCRHHDYGFHPMIDSSTIEYQIENYKSWLKYIDRFYSDSKTDLDKIMQLEVRDNTWTKDKIISYLKWLNFYINTDLERYFNNDIKEFGLFAVAGHDSDKLHYDGNYLPYHLLTNGKFSSCNIGTMLCIRVGDLTICPCHRTSYEKFLLGKYKIENNKIVGVEAKNIQLANTIFRTSFTTKPKCDLCVFEPFCLRGCLGAQYETYGEILYPCENNCELAKAKMTFLFLKYDQWNLFDTKFLGIEFFPPYLIQTKTLVETTKEYNEWKNIIQQYHLIK